MHKLQHVDWLRNLLSNHRHKALVYNDVELWGALQALELYIPGTRGFKDIENINKFGWVHIWQLLADWPNITTYSKIHFVNCSSRRPSPRLSEPSRAIAPPQDFDEANNAKPCKYICRCINEGPPLRRPEGGDHYLGTVVSKNRVSLVISM